MSIKIIPALLIGELCAGAVVNDDGVTYIGLGPIGEESEMALSVDEVEARALHEWLGRALSESV